MHAPIHVHAVCQIHNAADSIALTMLFEWRLETRGTVTVTPTE